jgi:hypothetical protein
MKLLFLSFFILFSSGSPELIRTIETAASDFDVDDLGFVYTVHRDRIVKLHADGTFFYEFSFKNSGRIGQLNVVDPLKPLVFYVETGDLIVLDNTMSQQRDMINLYNYGFGEVLCAATSVDHHYWVFDRYNGELQRLNDSFKIVTSTGNVKQVLGENLSPHIILERNNRVFLCDKEKGIYVFDIFGAYLQKIAEPNVQSLTVFDDVVCYHKEDRLYAYHLTFKTRELVQSGTEQTQKLMFRNGKVYDLGANVLSVYGLKEQDE